MYFMCIPPPGCSLLTKVTHHKAPMSSYTLGNHVITATHGACGVKKAGRCFAERVREVCNKHEMYHSICDASDAYLLQSGSQGWSVFAMVSVVNNHYGYACVVHPPVRCSIS